MTVALPESRQKTEDPRPENRVVGSPRSPAARAWSILSEPVELRQETDSIGTTTVSGVWCWLSRDPIGLAGGLNLYAYVGNNPVNRVDPLGLDWRLVSAFHHAVIEIQTDSGLNFYFSFAPNSDFGTALANGLFNRWQEGKWTQLGELPWYAIPVPFSQNHTTPAQDRALIDLLNYYSNHDGHMGYNLWRGNCWQAINAVVDQALNPDRFNKSDLKYE